ncbi:MAG: response regulator [Chloroflexi bacterium]|nr:response regulator [Chloroflexota bacterium]
MTTASAARGSNGLLTNDGARVASRSTSPANGPADLADELVSVRTETFSIVLVGVGVLLWLCIFPFLLDPLRIWPGWGTLLVMVVLSIGCFVLKRRHYRLASGLFVGTLLAGAGVFLLTPGEHALTPFLFIPAVLVAGTLQGSRAGFLAAALATAEIGLARPVAGATIQPLVMLGALALVWLTALTSWATTRNLYTALHWSWANSERAEENLAEARRYQGKLAATLRQLEEATYRLERANYALAWARAEADEARRLKAQFAAHVSHELRTPINLVVGFAELMLHNPEAYDSAPLPTAYLTDLTALHRSARHLQGLIDDILDLSQIDAGEMPVLKDVTDIPAIVHEAVATARPLLDRKGLAIRVEIAPDLPLLYLDRLRIRQVLLNLLNNASRFTERGQVAIRVCRDEPDEKEVVIEVVDSGVGIPANDLGKLFEAFRQLETSTTRGRGGTGLGLAISKRFVELHGGRIWASSEGVGKGSTFGFALPIQPDDALTRDAPPDHAIRRRGLQAAAPAPTLVVLDDDPAIVNLFQRRLEGYRVVGAASPTEAIALAKRLQAHAIVADLPDADRLSAWHREWSSLAVPTAVRILGCPMPSGRRVARTMGLADYLVKPVTRETLLESVKAIAPLARTILVVDDEPQMVRLLCRILRSSSPRYQLLRAYGGEEGLGLIRQVRPDLVILDLLMPQVDGLTVLERMKQDPTLAATPVIAVSARGPVEAISPSAARTITLVNSRAFPVGELIHSVRQTLDSLPPAGVDEAPSEPAPGEEPVGSGAS